VYLSFDQAALNLFQITFLIKVVLLIQDFIKFLSKTWDSNSSHEDPSGFSHSPLSELHFFKSFLRKGLYERENDKKNFLDSRSLSLEKS